MLSNPLHESYDMIIGVDGTRVTNFADWWERMRVTDRREEVAEKVSRYNLIAIPVLEEDGRVVGFVTVDDAIDLLVEEETNRALRSGAVEAGALDEPYMATSLLTLVRKRASWLVLLFVGEMLTATAMGQFEDEIAKAVVLALFVPLIISSGGNSGSQASTLVMSGDTDYAR